MSKMRRKVRTSSAEVIPVRHAPWLAGIARLKCPISPDTSLPWQDDQAHNGWSARMFLHQILSNSHSHWRPSDTESLLSGWMLETSQVRVAGGSSASDALQDSLLDSHELYLTRQMVLGLCRRAVKRKRPLQRVLLHTPAGWLRRTVTVTSRGEGYAFSLPKSVNVFKDSPEAGLLAFLEAVVES